MILQTDRLTLVLTKRLLMKDTFAFLFALLLAPLSALHAADKPAHLFILSGQSNMAGMNSKLGFEPEVAGLIPNADVAYIKVAAGGQPIRYWVTEWDEIAKKHGIDPAINNRATDA